jgi:hypothetical protein
MLVAPDSGANSPGGIVSPRGPLHDFIGKLMSQYALYIQLPDLHVIVKCSLFAHGFFLA